jgi:phosphotransferase system HPr (HPr) family protein
MAPDTFGTPPAAAAAFAAAGGALDASGTLRSFNAVIRNRLGLHSRAAARLSQALEPYDCEISLEKGDLRADAKSILDLLSLCCPCNTRVTVTAEGPDAEAALMAAKEIIRNRFGEDE